MRRTGDLVFPRAQVVVFVDGCFWHGCSQHFQMPVQNRAYWEAKILGNARRDAETDAALRAAGWLPFRVWEHEDPADAAIRVAAAVAARRSGADADRST
jgi:DNA mismatch endonuclease (patch repair protein)